jgi:predicted TIM-barrel fold metal-dependent hydrolase
MTMDMEYAHIDGYYGIKIYNAIYADEDTTKKPIHYWYPAHGVWKRRADSYVRIDSTEREDNERQIDVKEKFTEEEHRRLKDLGITGLYHDIKKDGVEPISIIAAPCLTDEKETDTYEQWTKQLKYTEQVVLANPLKLLPLFHYDPRRWQLKGNQEVYNHVESDGLYLGYKIYTAQGYRPWDKRRLSILEDFYVNCCENQTPIMNHCTPEGAFTFDRDEYFDFVHPNDNDEDRKQKDANGEHIQEYFNEHFVSPDAWRQVLDATVNGTLLNKLRLCFAHFGGNTDLGKKWGRQIMEMVQKYPNLYADISSSFADEDFQDYFLKILKIENEEEKREKEEKPENMEKDDKNVKKKKTRLKDRILFGSDWYLTLLGGVDYVEYCQKAKKALDDIDSSLWFRFTQYNPCIFYRLYDENQIDRIAVNIIKRRQTDEIEDILGPIKQEDIKLIQREAAYIKQASIPYFNYKEWP